MNILVINQPIKNRGDEAAHRGLVRALSKACPGDAIRVAWLGEDPPGCDPMRVTAPNVVYENIPMRWGRARLPRFALMHHLGWALGRFHPAYRTFRARIREADRVISAPSGIMLGAFRTWKTLFQDLLVREVGKPFAYYSPSFGPKPEGRKGDALFWKLATEVLRGFDFLSIRDRKTMDLADAMGIRYLPSIDSAFLDSPEAELPAELEAEIAGRRSIVFVPNSLTWHVAWRRQADQARINRFYLDAAALLHRRFPDAKIVMLPQLFGRGRAGGDWPYFKGLAEKAGLGDALCVAGEGYGSDVQQALVARSDLVVGARYHSIVFAINNGVPFVSLSYEHKMDGLLEELGLKGRGVDVRGLGKEGFDAPQALAAVERLLNDPAPPLDAMAEAKRIAGETFGRFRDEFLFRVPAGGRARP